MSVPQVALGDLIREADPGFASGERSADGILQLRMNCVNSEGGLSLAVAPRVPAIPRLSRYLLEPGDVVFNATNSPELVGKCAFFPGHDEPVAFSNHFLRLRVRADRLDPSYLVRWLAYQWKRRVFQGMCTQWVNQASVRKERLLQLRLPLPSLAEQRRIAAVLDKVDGIRRKRREGLRLLDEFLRSAFFEMFGDPVRNEKGCGVVGLGELLDGIDSGWSPTCLARPAGEGEWGVLKLGAVTTCEYLERENKALKEGTRPRPDLEVRAGDILVTRKNTSELVAACAYVSSTRERLMLPDLVYRLRLKEQAPVVPTYLWQVLIHPGKRRQIQLLARGSAGSMPNISKGRLAAVAVPMPPIELQRRFGSVIAKAERLKATLRDQSASDTKLFDSLAQRAFRGEL